MVGGSAASNPTAQISLAGSNNGSNLRVARNLFTYEDRVSYTKGRHQFTFGAWFQRLQSNENPGAEPIWPGDIHQPANVAARHGRTLLYDPAPTPLGWRSWFGAFYAEDTIRLRPNLTLSLGFRDEFTTGWNEAHGRASTYTYPEWRHRQPADHRQLRLHREQCESSCRSRASVSRGARSEIHARP